MNYLELLNDPRMQELMQQKSRAYITWDELLDKPLPDGMGVRSTWEALQLLFKNIGVNVVKSSIMGHRIWYHRTAQLSDAAMHIFRECGTSSEIAQTIERSSGRHFLSSFRIDDVIASAKLDGLSFSEESVEEMLRLGRAPVSEVEKFIQNCYDSDEKLADYIDTPFSRDLFWEFYQIVADSSEGTEYPIDFNIKNSFQILGIRHISEEGIDQFLGFLSDYANNTDRDPEENEVFRAFIILESMHSLMPFGSLSTQIGRMAFKLYALKNGLPVLAVLPLSKARLAWEEGLITPPAVICSSKTLTSMANYLVTEDDVDLTLPQTILSQLTLLQVKYVKDKIRTWNERDEKVRELLQHEMDFNSRQRSIIARAMRSPDATFTIRYHQNNHGVSYATARHDLIELMEKGFLDMKPQGRAFVFQASETLNSSIEKHE